MYSSGYRAQEHSLYIHRGVEQGAETKSRSGKYNLINKPSFLIMLTSPVFRRDTGLPYRLLFLKTIGHRGSGASNPANASCWEIARMSFIYNRRPFGDLVLL